MITEIAHHGIEKMYSDIKRIIREQSFHQAQSRLYNTEWTHRMRQCRAAYTTAIERKIQRIRTENTKHK